MEVQGEKREMTDFRNFFAGEGGGVGKPEKGGLNICKIVYWEKGGAGSNSESQGAYFVCHSIFKGF